MTRRTFALFAALVVAPLACSGPDKAATSETPVEQPLAATTTEELPPDQGEGIAWVDKSAEQKKAYMKLTVQPRMQLLFAEHDPETYAKVTCGTCHGPGAKEGKFDMPSPDLPRLTDWEKLEAEQPQMMEFMKTKVVPEMAALLGQEPYNPETKTGFGCSGCHVME